MNQFLGASLGLWVSANIGRDDPVQHDCGRKVERCHCEGMERGSIDNIYALLIRGLEQQGAFLALLTSNQSQEQQSYSTDPSNIRI
jgi:hypothetical protein